MFWNFSYALENRHEKTSSNTQFRYKTEAFVLIALVLYAEDWMSCVGQYWKFGMGLSHLCTLPQKSKRLLARITYVPGLLTLTDISNQKKAVLI